MNIQHPLLKKIDILSLDNIDSAVTKIKELGLNCKIHNDTIIVKYPKNLKIFCSNLVKNLANWYNLR